MVILILNINNILWEFGMILRIDGQKLFVLIKKLSQKNHLQKLLFKTISFFNI